MTAIYLIERDFGKIGTEIIGYREHTRAKIVDLVSHGEWPELVKVLEVNEAEGTARDVTEDIAHDVLAQILAEDFGRMSAPVRAFLEDQVPDDLSFCVREYQEANAQFGVGA